jgi:hypothetical protein
LLAKLAVTGSGRASLPTGLASSIHPGKPGREQLTLIRIFEELHGRGYEGGYDAVRRYARRWSKALLPGRRAAADIWKQTREGEKVEDRPAYAKLIAEGVLDRCGMTLLAGKAVGAPFVGSIAATLALSEVLRLLHGGPVHRLIDVGLSASANGLLHDILMISAGSIREPRWRQPVPSGLILLAALRNADRPTYR